LVASVDLENCTRPSTPEWECFRVPLTSGDARVEAELVRIYARAAHRQDSKGTRWMPWHQETKKDVDGCDKPR
jgi:hypothetical protein